MTTFPNIADYAFLSDCEVSALVAPDGAIEWLCLPRPDSPSVFGALLDRSAGFFRFGPSGTDVPNQRRYVPGTNVLETTWHTPTGWLVVWDLLVVGPAPTDERRDRYRRVPGDTMAQGTLLRIATCSSGRVEVQANCIPQFDYGVNSGEWSYVEGGYERATVRSGDLTLDLTGSVRLGILGPRTYGRTTLEQGETAWLALSWGGDHPTSEDEAMAQLAGTEKYWRDWLAGATIADHSYRPFIERSALALKALSYAPTGAVMAAGTTSLPESPGGERNWDYRYTWIRDTGFMLQALHDLGFEWEAFEYFAFLVETVMRTPSPAPGHCRSCTASAARPTSPSTRSTTSPATATRGRCASATAPTTSTSTTCGGCSSTRWRSSSGGADRSRPPYGKRSPRSSTRPSSGSGTPTRASGRCGATRSTSSRRRSCAGSRSTGGCASPASATTTSTSNGGRRRRTTCRRRSCREGSTTAACSCSTTTPKDLDASNLLIPIMGFLPGDDERVRATVLAIADELTQDGLVLRYRVDSTDDGLSGEEGTFTICSFWLVSALTIIGEVDRARALFEKLLSFAGPLYLYAEEIDVSTGPAPRELPAGVHAPRADRRRPAADRGRDGAGVTHRVVVVGGGFGGLPACRFLAELPVEVTLIDRRNHHLFQPLLYQVATGILSPGQIAPPLRHVLRKHQNVKVELAEVDGLRSRSQGRDRQATGPGARGRSPTTA